MFQQLSIKGGQKKVLQCSGCPCDSWVLGKPQRSSDDGAILMPCPAVPPVGQTCRGTHRPAEPSAGQACLGHPALQTLHSADLVVTKAGPLLQDAGTSLTGDFGSRTAFESGQNFVWTALQSVSSPAFFLLLLLFLRCDVLCCVHTGSTGRSVTFTKPCVWPVFILLTTLYLLFLSSVQLSL